MPCLRKTHNDETRYMLGIFIACKNVQPIQTRTNAHIYSNQWIYYPHFSSNSHIQSVVFFLSLVVPTCAKWMCICNMSECTHTFVSRRRPVIELDTVNKFFIFSSFFFLCWTTWNGRKTFLVWLENKMKKYSRKLDCRRKNMIFFLVEFLEYSMICVLLNGIYKNESTQWMIQ